MPRLGQEFPSASRTGGGVIAAGCPRHSAPTHPCALQVVIPMAQARMISLFGLEMLELERPSESKKAGAQHVAEGPVLGTLRLASRAEMRAAEAKRSGE